MSVARYVLAFAFDLTGQVALIKKNRPDWQRGRLNGIGGKIEDGELPSMAMAREFEEETGVSVHPASWQLRGTMKGQSSFHIDVFTVKAPQIARVSTVGDELVALYKPEHLLPSRCIENVPALIALCMIPVAEPSGVFPTFELRY